MTGQQQSALKGRAIGGIGLIAACLTCGDAANAQRPFPLTSQNDLPIAVACTALSELELSELGAITAQWNAAGPATVTAPGSGLNPTSQLAAHCRVRGRVEPAIRFEVWLPAPEEWNGRFVAVGNGAETGNIEYAQMAPMLNQGYATASTDTGHAPGSTEWLADEGQLRDFAYRAIYEMTAKAGVIVTSFYRRPADYRYFNGCSLGGRQGLMEAERFPSDYDGIVAGSPVNAYVDSLMTEVWAMQAVRASIGGQSLLGPSDLALVTDAVTGQCDTLDDVPDGVLEDPRRCNFNPVRLQCSGVNAGRCLTAPQVQAVQQVYRGPWNAATGPIAPGLPLGSEAGWTFASRPEPSPMTLEFLRRAVFEDPLWNWRRFDFDADASLVHDRAGWLMDATSADLATFRDQGGKLLLYHGWNDTVVSAEATIAYYEALESTLRRAANPLEIPTQEFARLFLVPGMGQCGGGAGTSRFDAQRAIENWVERGIAPDRIEAERIDDRGQVDRTRPLCPYPQTARYRGTGNSDRTGSFVCSD